MDTRNSAVALTDAEIRSVAISSKHQAQLHEYRRQHQDEKLTDEQIVALALDEFLEKNLGGDSMRTKPLSVYKYLQNSRYL
jgi:hypothetical protein